MENSARITGNEIDWDTHFQTEWTSSDEGW